MTEAIGGGGELIGDTRIDGGIVALVAADDIGAEQGRQEFIEGNRLYFSRNDLPRLLIELFVSQTWIFQRQFGGNSIMLPHPDGLHRRQCGVFVGANVAGQKETVISIGEQVPIAGCQQSSLKCSQTGGQFRIRTIDHRTIDERRNLIDLLPNAVFVYLVVGTVQVDYVIA